MKTKTHQIKTMTLTKQQIDLLHHQLQAFPLKTIQHAYFHAKLDDGSIVAYQSGKVVFTGEMAFHYAAQFEEKIITQAGSDEVGTGDYFGPVVVCATYIDEDIYKQLSQYSIMDSKQMDDNLIYSIAPILMDVVPHSVLILDNETYNTVHKRLNLNAIKAQLHQKAFDHLQNKLGHPLPNLSIVDQFAPKESYYRYLDDDYGITHLKFETKAENKYISVAIGAIIARYTFLLALKQFSSHYQMEFPKGAGIIVDDFGIQFVKKYGVDELNKVAKLHFKNTERIKEKAN